MVSCAPRNTDWHIVVGALGVEDFIQLFKAWREVALPCADDIWKKGREESLCFCHILEAILPALPRKGEAEKENLFKSF